MTTNGYIFLGPEIGKKRDAIEAVRKKTAGAAEKSVDETVFYAGETSSVEIANSVQNHSLFAAPRLFIIKNAELIKKKEETALIASCMRELDSETALVLCSDEFKLATGLDDCVPKENRKVFYELFENEKSEWVRSFFAREGYRIDPDGVDTILELVENNTDAMRRECSRLILFLPKEKPATAEEIEKWLSHSREESAFSLFSRIASGDISRSVESLHALLAARESATGILATLAWCFKKLRDYLVLAANGGESNNFELKKIGLSSPKARSDYASAARRYNAAAADACLALTAEYDILTRANGAAFESVLMDAYVIKIFSLCSTKN
ncbi:MAG: DNA polymerase III subunit delta [Treponema sp.]|jgi:DNA polymerase-3 subunit delta|nr:DNA polymerase III subunit delta [Treponema sp.]